MPTVGEKSFVPNGFSTFLLWLQSPIYIDIMQNANQSTFCVAQSYDTLHYLKSISFKLLSLAD
ncbi:hypothetical protein SAMN05421877_103256 [Sphingobacterium lactis]|uniref:Uncharacterized protein n=1 Tax=Sphingobacterium lactis TaxID=797291 RepID=A0A1H5VY66_9SPHI|nr:hypothetical protein SAMN05421877_103256 [Sphingobacterium lactis]